MSEARGYRALQGWGEGPVESDYATGDVVWIPPDSPAVTDDRCGPGLNRVISVFSICEGPSFYYRVEPMAVAYARGYRLRADHTDWVCSDRLHVIPGKCDFTEGWIRLYEAAPLPALTRAKPKEGPVICDA